MNNIAVVIIDDEPLARDNLKELLSVYPEICIIGEADSVISGQKVINEKKPQAIFLDIHLSGGSGFDVLSGCDLNMHVIFVTAYDQYAIRAFEVNAIDYLLKPVDRTRLGESVNRIMSFVQEKNDTQPLYKADNIKNNLYKLSMDDLILVEDGKRQLLISLEKIAIIKGRGNYSDLLTWDKKQFLTRIIIKDWISRLPMPPFIKLDRSLVINFNSVESWQRKNRKIDINLKSKGNSIMLGRAASERFKEYIKQK